MLAELQSRAEQAVETAQAVGADEVWASITQNRDVEFNYRDGALENVKDTTSRTLTVSIYAAGRYSSHNTTDLEPARLRAFLHEAVMITAALEPDEFRDITPPELFENRPTVNLQLLDPQVLNLDRDKRRHWCEALDEAAHRHERVISATSGVYDGTVTTAAASSNGFSGTSESSYCWLGAEVSLRDRDDRRAEDWFYAGARHLKAIPDPAFIAGEALHRAVARLGSEKGPTLKATMLVDSRAAADLVDRLLSPATAARVQQGRSFWAKILGEKAFSDKLSIVDDPLIRRAFGSRLFDSEGISAKLLPIVGNGVARNLYVDTYYGRKLEMQPTTGTPSNRKVMQGNQSLDDLLRDVGSGVYVTSWLGGNSDSTTGDFSLGLRGHMIENGVIGRPVGEMNVTGNLKSLFDRLEAVGNDTYPYAFTLSPSLVFSGVDFSGA